MSVLTLRSVSKTFGTAEVIHGVSFDIADGEFVVLVGPSGCGKSTLLRMIAGLEEITAGEISIGDRVVNQVKPRDRDVAMVFQNYALYPHMTVAKNMGFSLKLRGENREVIERKVRETAMVLGLVEYLDRYPRELSGGQRQRVAMGRSIVRNPRVFLFDEPLSNLDARLRVQMRTEIRSLHQRLRTTTVYVTHDQIEAMTMADRIVVLRDGRVEQVGAPLELYDRPANTFVAGFIGSPAMNLLAELPAGAAPGLPVPKVEGKVIYGVRPEHVTLSVSGAPATVSLVEPTGPETHLVLRLGSQDVLAVVRERALLQPGDTVGVSIDPSNVHSFDRETGVRIAG